MNEQANEQINRWKNEHSNKWMIKQKNRCIMTIGIDEWTINWMNTWTNEWMSDIYFNFYEQFLVQEGCKGRHSDFWCSKHLSRYQEECWRASNKKQKFFRPKGKMIKSLKSFYLQHFLVSVQYSTNQTQNIYQSYQLTGTTLVPNKLKWLPDLKPKRSYDWY